MNKLSWNKTIKHVLASFLKKDLGSKFIPASILYKSTADRYQPVSYPDGPITARCRFIKNASWDSFGVDPCQKGFAFRTANWKHKLFPSYVCLQNHCSLEYINERRRQWYDCAYVLALIVCKWHYSFSNLAASFSYYLLCRSTKLHLMFIRICS